MSGELRTAVARQAQALYNDVQLMREMHWSYEQLLATPDDIVWAALRVLSLESEKHEDEMRRSGSGRPGPAGPVSAANYRPRADPPPPPGPPPKEPTGPIPIYAPHRPT